MRSITSIIQEAVPRALAKAREEDQRLGPQPAWYPSVMTYGCDRHAILSRAGADKKPLEDVTLRKFWMGSSIHTALQRLVEEELADKEGFKFLGNELQVRDDAYHVAGRIDTLVEVDGELEVWEYKSISSQAFRYGLPREDHILQVGIYLTFPASPKGKGNNLALFKHPLPARARLIYWSKDDARIQEYIITPEYTFEDGVNIQDKVRDTLQRLEVLYAKYQNDGSLPPPIEVHVTKKGKVELDWRAFYCDFRGSGKCCADEG